MSLSSIQVLVLFIALAAHCAITFTIFRSAHDSGMDGLLWAGFYIFTLPIGLVAILIVRTLASNAGVR